MKQRHFMRWAADEGDVLTKVYFYPNIEKNRIIPDGYVAEKSGHSRGSTVDLTWARPLIFSDLHHTTART